MNTSTFSWWASVLSDATEVYVPMHWKWKKKIIKIFLMLHLKLGYYQIYKVYRIY